MYQDGMRVSGTLPFPRVRADEKRIFNAFQPWAVTLLHLIALNVLVLLVPLAWISHFSHWSRSVTFPRA